jgi:hypothetical protein
MGDPTLRMHPLAPVSNLSGSSDVSGAVNLNWTAPGDSVAGYHVYRSSNRFGPFTRLSMSLVTATRFTDSTPGTGSNTYMVRAIKLETSASGSYYNPSQGIFFTLNAPPPTTTVMVMATDPNASRVGSDPGTLVVTCSRNPGTNLIVEYTLGGTATKLVDYRRAQGDMPESIVIPAGTNFASLVIFPQASTNVVDAKTLVLTLKTNAAYAIGSPAAATVNIAGNTLAAGISNLDRFTVRLAWQSTSNTYYRIAYKDDVADLKWKYLGFEIRANTSNTFWAEPIQARRFYRVLQSH